MKSSCMCSTVLWSVSVRASRKSVECSLIASADRAHAMVRVCCCRTAPRDLLSGHCILRKREGCLVGRKATSARSQLCVACRLVTFIPTESVILTKTIIFSLEAAAQHWTHSPAMPPQELSSRCGVVWRLWSEDEEKRLERLVEAFLARRHVPSSAAHGSSQPSSLQVRKHLTF